MVSLKNTIVVDESSDDVEIIEDNNNFIELDALSRNITHRRKRKFEKQMGAEIKADTLTEENGAPKKPRMENAHEHEHSELSYSVDHLRQNDFGNVCRTRQSIPHNLIRLKYQLDLSVLCLLRKKVYKHKYDSLSLSFGDYEIDKFNNIVIRYESKSIHIQIENERACYADNEISCDTLFNKSKCFYINNYFNSFVKHRISKCKGSSHDVEFLVIYTNAGLSLTEEKKLQERQTKNFYPFKFDKISLKKCAILKDFLFTKRRSFYQFSQEEEVLKRLEFSPDILKVIKERKLSEVKLKEGFLKKLVFVVNQPNREKLNTIVRSEMETVHRSYKKLQERILCKITKQKRIGTSVTRMIYEFNLLTTLVHDMFLHKNIFAVNFEEKNCNIIINYKTRITYLKVYRTDRAIGYNQLFPGARSNDTFSINKHFALFAKELQNEIRYFIIYTNGKLDINKDRNLKKGRSIEFYPLKFDCIDYKKKKYKVLRDCSCMNKDGLYQFSKEPITRTNIFRLLRLPALLKEQEKISDEHETIMKEKFIHKLIFAVNQDDKEVVKCLTRNEIEKSNVPYNYGELHEITLRWLENHKLSLIEKTLMMRLLEDIKINKSTCPEIQNKDINELIIFARNMVGRKNKIAFHLFLDFLTEREGKKCFEVLKRENIRLSSISGIAGRASFRAQNYFRNLYDLWFDKDGNKTHYLKALDNNKINLANISAILRKTNFDGAEAFKALCDLWFDKEGNKTKYLESLERENINLSTISHILNGAGPNAATICKDFFDLLFDEKGNKTQYLEVLQKEAINLSMMSSILGKAGSKATQSFKDLYNMLFDENGHKTHYLRVLEKGNINLSSMFNMLGGSGSHAAKSFKDLFDLWFDEKGKKTEYLESLEKEKVNLSIISSMLGGSRYHAAKNFKDLFDLWFGKEGTETPYLKTLKKNQINLHNVSSILHLARCDAANSFKDLYDLWFDKKGNKTKYLETLEKENINLSTITCILSGAGSNAANTFKSLYNLWFDEKGNKKKHLKALELEKINLATIASIFSRSGSNAAKSFEDLYSLWFDEEGKKTHYLKALEKEGVPLSAICTILTGSRYHAPKTFKVLFNLWFDEKGNTTQYLKPLQKEGINLHALSSALSRSGSSAVKVFKEWYRKNI